MGRTQENEPPKSQLGGLGHRAQMPTQSISGGSGLGLPLLPQENPHHQRARAMSSTLRDLSNRVPFSPDDPSSRVPGCRAQCRDRLPPRQSFRGFLPLPPAWPAHRTPTSTARQRLCSRCAGRGGYSWGCCCWSMCVFYPEKERGRERGCPFWASA